MPASGSPAATGPLISVAELAQALEGSEPPVLIDDQPRNLQVFAGRGVLFSAPHNLNVSGFTRVDDWAQVERLFLMEGGVE